MKKTINLFLLISLLFAMSTCKKDSNNNSNNNTSVTVPVLTTTAVTPVAQTTATSGGTITSDGGSSVIARGVCWSTSQNPTVANSKTTDGTGTGSFTSSITGLTPNTSYYVRAYATNSAGTGYGNSLPFITQQANSGDCGNVIDADGNVYPTITIGTQCWMQWPLETTKYNDGTAIPNVTDDNAWANLKTPAYCWYQNNAYYAALYNWYAVNTGKLCPTGWHVPTYNEWNKLGSMEFPGSLCGYRNGSYGVGGPGWFWSSGEEGYWWSSTKYNASEAWTRCNDDAGLDYKVYMEGWYFDYGMSVCCVKNQ